MAFNILYLKDSSAERILEALKQESVQYEADSFTNVREAERMINSKRYDLVLLTNLKVPSNPEDLIAEELRSPILKSKKYSSGLQILLDCRDSAVPVFVKSYAENGVLRMMEGFGATVFRPEGDKNLFDRKQIGNIAKKIKQTLEARATN